MKRKRVEETCPEKDTSKTSSSSFGMFCKRFAKVDQQKINNVTNFKTIWNNEASKLKQRGLSPNDINLRLLSRMVPNPDVRNVANNDINNVQKIVNFNETDCVRVVYIRLELLALQNKGLNINQAMNVLMDRIKSFSGHKRNRHDPYIDGPIVKPCKFESPTKKPRNERKPSPLFINQKKRRRTHSEDINMDGAIPFPKKPKIEYGK
eukprot:TRINITY_DN5755_c0_g1_i1.p1 TRINITY_DN5755_c0_g1~~TRINITY_DN5755_c0_g1_i1.p1  ORF type:complete len:207 (+),score=36.42 TRINITY_DN5755_c0_g1_i1:114-734(+)